MANVPVVTNFRIDPAARGSSGYKTAREASQRAAVTATSDSAATTKALVRMEKLLTSADAPRRDVPRGYYLDITI